MIPPVEIARFPHANGAGCRQLEITPTDSRLPIRAGDFIPGGYHAAYRRLAGGRRNASLGGSAALVLL